MKKLIYLDHAATTPLDPEVKRQWSLFGRKISAILPVFITRE